MPSNKFRDKIRKAFSLLEYALLIAVVVAALMAMAFYIKRSVSGKWRDTIDAEIGHGRQYDPLTTSEK